jgi:hypothetical protein
MAKEEDVLIAISSDAHSTRDFDNLYYGVGQARRGWLEKKGCAQWPLAERAAQSSKENDVGCACAPQAGLNTADDSTWCASAPYR